MTNYKKAKLRKQARESFDYDLLAKEFPGFNVIEDNNGDMVQASDFANVLTDLPGGSINPYSREKYPEEEDIIFLGEVEKQLNKRGLQLFTGFQIGDDFSDLYAGRYL